MKISDIFEADVNPLPGNGNHNIKEKAAQYPKEIEELSQYLLGKGLAVPGYYGGTKASKWMDSKNRFGRFDDKQIVIPNMLKAMKVGEYRNVITTINAIKRTGINWPEFKIISDSLKKHYRVQKGYDDGDTSDDTEYNYDLSTVLEYLPYFQVSDLREAFNKCSSETQKVLISIVQSLDSSKSRIVQGYRDSANYWTELQKKKVLSALTPPLLNSEQHYDAYKKAIAAGAITVPEMVKRNLPMLLLAKKYYRRKLPDIKIGQQVIRSIAYLGSSDKYYDQEELKTFAKYWKGQDLSSLIADIEKTTSDGPPSSSNVLNPKAKAAVLGFFKSIKTFS